MAQGETVGGSGSGDCREGGWLGYSMEMEGLSPMAPFYHFIRQPSNRSQRIYTVRRF